MTLMCCCYFVEMILTKCFGFKHTQCRIRKMLKTKFIGRRGNIISATCQLKAMSIFLSNNISKYFWRNHTKSLDFATCLIFFIFFHSENLKCFWPPVQCVMPLYHTLSRVFLCDRCLMGFWVNGSTPCHGSGFFVTICKHCVCWILQS